MLQDLGTRFGCRPTLQPRNGANRISHHWMVIKNEASVSEGDLGARQDKGIKYHTLRSKLW